MIGDIVWRNGDEFTIASEPFLLHGGEFVYAVESATGIVKTIATKKQHVDNSNRNMAEWKQQQIEFARLVGK